jgi:type 1 glutamine amidotransferase
MRKVPLGLTLLASAALFSATAEAEIKKVTLFVNYGGGAILHEQAIVPFKNTLNAMQAEKGFQLTISEKTNTAAQRSAALNALKDQDVVLFANIGENSFTSTADQALIESFFMNGGKGMGFHATIDHHKYWKWWEDLHNGSGFQGHSNGAFKLTTDPEMSRIPALKKMWDENQLGEPNISSTEIYTLNVYPRGKPGVTLMQTAPPLTGVPSHDFTWHKQIGKGEYIFTCLGHAAADFTGGWMQKALWAWMLYLNGEYNTVSNVHGDVGMKPNSIQFADKTLKVHYEKPFSMTVVNVMGETKIAKSGEGKFQFNLAELQTGIYFVNVKGAAGTHSRRILIK